MTKKQPDIDALVEEATDRGRLRRENSELREQVRTYEEELAKVRRRLDLAEQIEAAKPAPPRWTRRTSKGGNPATPVLLITDTHFDEVVRPEEVLGLNRYDRRIAGQRLERAFTGAAKVAKDYISGFDYDGIVLALGGDIVSGEIHEELRRTNEATTVETLVHWLEPMVAGVRLLAEEFGRVHVVGVVGNHGRRDRKPVAKMRAKDNYDWLLYQLMAREFSSAKEVSFQVPEAADAIVPVYDTRMLLTHGDQFRGGSGISSAMSPLLLGEHRKTKKHVAASRYGGEDVGFDLLVMGHWHSRYILPRLIVGGTLKGYDEYAMVSNFEFAPPSQEMFLVAPQRGVILNTPIFVQDRRKEGW